MYVNNCTSQLNFLEQLRHKHACLLHKVGCSWLEERKNFMGIWLANIGTDLKHCHSWTGESSIEDSELKRQYLEGFLHKDFPQRKPALCTKKLFKSTFKLEERNKKKLGWWYGQVFKSKATWYSRHRLNQAVASGTRSKDEKLGHSRHQIHFGQMQSRNIHLLGSLWDCIMAA